MRKTIVISLGGSMIIPKEGFDLQFLKSFKKTILSLINKYRFIIVCGGGQTARSYQKIARDLGELHSEDLDWIGIHATRLNGHLMRTIFRKYAHPAVVKYPLVKQDWKKPIMFAAGWKPGFSTDYDAVLLAKKYGADIVINMSNVDYIYDKDPRIFKDAKKLEKINWDDFQKIVGKKWIPGANLPFDPIASILAKKNKMKVLFVKGDNVKEVKKAIEGKKIKGTIIESR